MYKLARDSTEDNRAAINKYKKSIDIALQINDNHIIEWCYGQIAHLNFLDSSYVEAIINNDKAIEYSIKGRSNKNYIWSRQKADNYFELGKYNLALKEYSKAEDGAVAQNDLFELYTIYFERSRIYLKIDLFELLEKTVEKMIHLAKKINYKRMNRVYQKLGNLNRRSKNYKMAIKFYEMAIDSIKYDYKPWTLRKIKSYNCNKIGDCYIKLKDYKKAEKYYKKAFLFADSVQSKYYCHIALLDLCELYVNLNNLVKAKEYLGKLDSLNIDKAELELKIRKNVVLGKIFLTDGDGDLDSSLFYFKKSLALFEKQINTLNIERARSGYINSESDQFSNITNIYRKLIYKDQNNLTYIDSLFKYSNIIRSRTLSAKNIYENSTMDSTYISSMNSLEKYQRGLRQSEQSSFYENDVELNGLRYQLLTDKLYQFSNQIASINQISLPDFKKYLNQTKSSALIYNLNKEDQYILYIDSDTSQIIDLDLDPDSLSQKINYFVKSAFSGKSPEQNKFDTEVAYELYLHLWKPLEQRVRLNKNIIIIPDNPILTLPFDILMDNPGDKKIYTSTQQPLYIQKLLVNKFNFSILPSANLIESLKPVKNQNQYLIVANPDFGAELNIDRKIVERTGWSFEQLLYSKSEAKSIKKIMPDAIVLEQKHATVDNVIHYLSNSSIIHFATHAFVDTVFDMFSGLVVSLGEDSTDDGLLMGYEINDLDLNCDLVTLSACESGQGKIYNNEGIMGLPRLFLEAGARSTLMTLWKVNDKLSSDLIPHFYSNLIESNMSKIEALGNAKRYILEKYNKPINGIYYNNPFYWASFNLYGDIKNNISYSNNFHAYLYIIFFISCVLLFLYLRKRLTLKQL